MKELPGGTITEKLQAATTMLRRLEAKTEASGHRPVHVSPFILSGHVDIGSMLAYISINCTIDSIDIQVDSIEASGEKPEATMSISVMPISGLATSFNLKVKPGHNKSYPQYKITSPVRIAIKFDKPVSAWICIVAYPILTKQVVPVEEVEGEGIQLPGI